MQKLLIAALIISLSLFLGACGGAERGVEIAPFEEAYAHEAEPETENVINVIEENIETHVVGEPEEPQDTQETVELNIVTLVSEAEEKTFTISVSCETVFDNMDKLRSGKEEIVPESGYILPETEMVLLDGESAFDALLRVTKEKRMHMEHSKTPILKSSYVEGIGNLYEFDCGELSGWAYKVNGEVMGYGSSLHELSPGDVVEIAYTCDLGFDIGGNLNP